MNLGKMNEEALIQELHFIKIHQLQYYSLLTDLQATVEFIQAIPSSTLEKGEKHFTETVLGSECGTLLKEVRELFITLESMTIEKRVTEMIASVHDFFSEFNSFSSYL